MRKERVLKEKEKEKEKQKETVSKSKLDKCLKGKKIETVHALLPRFLNPLWGKEGADFTQAADFRCGCRLILEGHDILTESF